MKFSETLSTWSKARRWGAAVVLLLVAALLFVVSGQTRFPDLPDLAAIEDTATRKQAFYDYLLPIVHYHNDLIQEDRQRLATVVDKAGQGEEPGWLEQRWLGNLSAEYEVEYSGDNLPEVLTVLQRRVDTIPPELAMAQAAVESGWGRSRFAVEANNLFGQRCYEEGCGLAPQGRKSARFEVREFPSISEAIRRYMNNLNTHEEYRGFRDIRAQLRQKDEEPRGEVLVKGLSGYSTRGEEYISQLSGMMRRNRSLLEKAGEA
ncbi:Bax protein [Parahaliea maris]|uniref:Bax protein n=1 Tax=Parahaliea maris TaxID=2716870 RepID=A0A5C8ZVM7_9GAMM|nr:glucosaminidase domain-containing protein [Parahaliea maris]TXS91899.1 Bax protein [Parahaliea maris]